MAAKIAKEQLRSISLIAVFFVLGLYVYFQYLFIPMSRDSRAAKEQLRVARDKLKLLETATANEAALQAQYHQLEQAVAALKRSMPNETELSSILEVLSSLATSAGVKIQNIFPQRQVQAQTGRSAAASREPEVYREMPIQIDAVAGFHELGVFLNAVESGEKPMQVMTLRIATNPKDPRRHQVNLLIKAYFSVGETTRPAAS